MSESFDPKAPEEAIETETETEPKILEMREDEPPKKGLSDKAKKELREWIVSLAVAVIVAFLLRTFIFTVIRVDGESMRETLQDHDRMIVTIIDMKLLGVRHGDVVICKYPERKENFVKRVVGLPGDTVRVSAGVTYVNDEALDEPYITHKPTYEFGPMTVPEGTVFVLGDNRSNSHDSHSLDVGPLDQSQLIGIARLVIWPPRDIGLIPGE